MNKQKKVFVGLSGGVDSSVAAALLARDGYDVTGVYMKNWSVDIAGVHCPWREDLASARSVAAHLKIPFKIYDFEADYKRTVVDYMVEAYKKGITPNPDVMCNAEIKFKVFARKCFDEGADFVSTGHYARIGFLSQHNSSSDSPDLTQRSDDYASLRASNLPRFASEQKSLDQIDNEKPILMMSKDARKDQTYFLYRMSQTAAERTLFPLGDFDKSEVRDLAREYKLPTAQRKDSQGLCFVGKVPLRDFLGQYIEASSGDIIDDRGKTVGTHDGAFYYTIGQRHGLGIGGGAPYFVYSKDVKNNIVYVTTDLRSKQLNSNKFDIADCVWWSTPNEKTKYKVRIRHGGELLPAKIKQLDQKYVIELDKAERAIAPGQSAVLYDGDVVLGGGVIV